MPRTHPSRVAPFLVMLGLLACSSRSDPPQKTPDRTIALPTQSDTGFGPGIPDAPTPPADSGAPGDSAEPDHDAGDTPALARHLPTPEPALTVSDTIDPPGDEDWFRVELDAGDTLWVASLAALRTPPSPLAPLLELRNERGEALELVRGMPLSIAENDSAVAFEAPAAGAYFIGVRAADPAAASLEGSLHEGGPEHAYSLRLERAPPFETEPHNDSSEAMRAWLAEDGHYAYRGDPFIAGWPLFSFRADRSGDRDMWPWEVRGALEDGSPAAAELWSFSPWAGCAPSSTWSVTTESGAPALLATAHTRDLLTDPLYQLARHGLPVLPDVGLMVSAPPGTLWLTVDHDSTADAVGSACTGILAGWTTDYIPTLSTLPQRDGAHILSSIDRTSDQSTALTWGTIADGETIDFRLSASTDRPHTHILLQAHQFGHPVDLTLTLYEGDVPVTSVAENPISGGPDPEHWNWASPDGTELRFSLTAASGTGAFLLQVHQTAAVLP